MKKLKKKAKKNNLIFLIFGLLFIVLGLLLLTFNFLQDKYSDYIEEEAIDNYYIKESEIEIENEDTIIEEDTKKISTKKVEKINYIATLKIPKINLEKGLVEPSSYMNNIKYGIQILDGSSMPDKDKTNLILASHSGTARISFFKNLDKLSIGDKAIVNYKNKNYNYKVVRIYDILKDGTANLVYNKNKTNLILITCRYKTNNQIIIVCELEK